MASIEMKSYYFGKYDAEPSGYVKTKLLELKKMIQEQHVQIIEINSFSNIESGYEANVKLSQERIDNILKLLEVDGESITQNTYGNKRIKVNFTPTNWSRVDIYYNIEVSIWPSIENQNTKTPPKVDTISKVEHLSETTKKDNSTDKAQGPAVIKYSTKGTKRAVPEIESIVEGVAIVLPIKFQGGSSDFLIKSYQYLEHLYNTLDTHKELHAHIRGHVCCGPSMRLSKLRAKEVYNYLVDKGIDPKRLSYKGYSNTKPIVIPELSDKDRKQNRRVDIILSKHP